MNPVFVLRCAKYGVGLAGALLLGFAYGELVDRVFDPMIERAGREEASDSLPAIDVDPAGPTDEDEEVSSDA